MSLHVELTAKEQLAGSKDADVTVAVHVAYFEPVDFSTLVYTHGDVYVV